MAGWLGVRTYVVVVVILFLASLGVLFAQVLVGVTAPWRERPTREEAIRLAELLAIATEPLTNLPPQDRDRRLTQLALRLLADRPGFEAGFYLPEPDLFLARVAPHPPPPSGPGQPLPPPPKPPPTPPPIEARLIRELAQESDDLPVAARTQVVGPHRVVVAVARIAEPTHTPMRVWVLARVGDLGGGVWELRRTQISAGLALGGVLLSLGLAATLAQGLNRARDREARLRDDLRHAEHLASLGRMLAGVAHEVRNPLAAIRSTVQLWERLPDTTRTPASLQAVVAGVDRLDELVSRLLQFTRSGRDAPQALDMNAIVRETAELLRAQATEQNVSLELDLAGDLPKVTGSPTGVRQVVLNLASNALQAIAHEGQVRFTTTVLESGVRLTVADTGSGVADEVRSRLFEPFTTTRPEGTGLGLALCREIVQQHGGRIGLDETTSGARFWIWLPETG